MLTGFLGGIVASVAVAAPAAGQELLADPRETGSSATVTLLADNAPIFSETFGEGRDTPGTSSLSRGPSGGVNGFGYDLGLSTSTDFFSDGSSASADNIIGLRSFASASLNASENATGDAASIVTTSQTASFSITQPVRFRLTGSITIDAMSEGASFGELHAMVALSDAGTLGDFILIDERLTESTVIPIDFEGEFLESSFVQLTTRSFAFAFAEDVGAEVSVSVRNDVTMEFLPIPTPGALPAFACAGLLTFRRRRASV